MSLTDVSTPEINSALLSIQRPERATEIKPDKQQTYNEYVIYGDTSANKDNSFRNHYSLAKIFVSRNTHTDGKDKLLEWPDHSCLLLYVSTRIH
jgi:hypothetical protein